MTEEAAEEIVRVVQVGMGCGALPSSLASVFVLLY